MGSISLPYLGPIGSLFYFFVGSIGVHILGLLAPRFIVCGAISLPYLGAIGSSFYFLWGPLVFLI